ncbi:CHAP domain-containing protein [Podospora australis]|uniref:CHAP domain-containing protein n=1 Tax=Podospora australis TaxID=1536484 RepID=A0AAN7AEN9_9PEZI|nr:CHAP domain-containing protein [Podospora australis]
MKYTTAAFFLFQLITWTPGVTAYPITGNVVNCRSGPGTSYSTVKQYTLNTDVKITCQTSGTSVNGNAIWDKTSDNCYVADYYVKTGTNGYVTTKCGSSSSPSPSVPGPVVNDYPYKSSCGGTDPWLYFKCQCTSFVAWRINERLGIKFHNKYKGAAWGNANSWDEAAKATGVTINNTPKPGSIAQTSDGKAGHVAWVTAVNGDKVTIEEYNWSKVEGYGTRTVAKGSFKYIHLK